MTWRIPLRSAWWTGTPTGPRMWSKRCLWTWPAHDWQVESPFIGGSLEVGPNFPIEPGQAATPGKVEAKAEVFVSVRSLKSVEKDGKPYSDKMDEIMWEKLGIAQNPKIFYRLSELTLKEAAKSKDAPYVFDAKGEMVVGGVTNTVSMPVNVTP
ncbi:MAG TPA: hypothetical protein VNT26_14415, partial [Candidatus Sulfotelmatobacter sp.]|nr:hypothetical protein [Candidatus Sulfotelmatobacter sp.]